MTVAELKQELEGCLDTDIVDVHIIDHGKDTFMVVTDCHRGWDKRGCVMEIGKHRDEDDYLLG